LKAKIVTLTATIASDSKQQGLLKGELAALKKQIVVLMNDEEAAKVRSRHLANHSRASDNNLLDP